MKIISGGQTGVDRAALDVALKRKIPCGGWCPQGRRDELGRIPERYPLREVPGGGFDERTRENVIASDGTVIFCHGTLTGGSRYTEQCCREQGRPCLLISEQQISAEAAARLISDFVREHGVEVLNVAGPRLSEWPAGYDYCFRVLELFLTFDRDQTEE